MKPSQEALSELMFLVLIELYDRDTFGIDIAESISKKTNQRIQIGPGTLYTILARFEKDGWIEEIAVEGRKRTYHITSAGQEIFHQEISRLEEILNIAYSVQHKERSS